MGSGNIGATNVLRTGRKDIAALTLLLDGGKGAVAALVMGSQGPIAALVAGVAAVVGHCTSPLVGFKGGKGVATGLGVVLAWSWQAGLLCLLALARGRVRLAAVERGALTALAAAPFLLWAFAGPEAALAGGLVAALGWTRHHANIARLVAGTEPRIGAKG